LILLPQSSLIDIKSCSNRRKPLKLYVYLEKIVVQNFRNFRREFFEFTPYRNIIYGLNGTGKTNLLEAIIYISSARSFRDVEDKDLLRWGESFFRVEGKLVGDRISYEVKILFVSEKVNGRKKKEVLMNGKPVKRVYDLLRLWPSVTLSSSDHRLLDGSPQIRRRYFDRLISVVDPFYSSYLYRYRRSLQQKNALLKSGKNFSNIVYWNRKLEELGSYIVDKRSEWVAKITGKITETFKSFSPRKLEVRYTPSISMEEGTLDLHLDEEIRERLSLFGPHRDEINFFLDDQVVRIAASEGEKRLILFSWVMAQREILREVTNTDPVLALDDPLSVLGEDKARILLEMCEGQVFITTVRRIPEFDPLIVLGGSA